MYGGVDQNDRKEAKHKCNKGVNKTRFQVPAKIKENGGEDIPFLRWRRRVLHVDACGMCQKENLSESWKEYVQSN